MRVAATHCNTPRPSCSSSQLVPRGNYGVMNLWRAATRLHRHYQLTLARKMTLRSILFGAGRAGRKYQRSAPCVTRSAAPSNAIRYGGGVALPMAPACSSLRLSPSRVPPRVPLSPMQPAACGALQCDAVRCSAGLSKPRGQAYREHREHRERSNLLPRDMHASAGPLSLQGRRAAA